MFKTSASPRHRHSRIAGFVLALVAAVPLRTLAQQATSAVDSGAPPAVQATMPASPADPALSPRPPAPPAAAPDVPRWLPPPAPEPTPSEPSLLVGSVSGGLGIPYGVLGVGVTLGADYVSLTGGVGTSYVAGVGYSAGVRIHVLDTSYRFRPHLTAVYGTTAAYQITGFVHETGTLRGFGFFAGFDHDFRDHGGWFATYGIGYITHEELPQSVKNLLERYGFSEPSTGAPIKLMVGLGYRVGGR